MHSHLVLQPESLYAFLFAVGVGEGVGKPQKTRTTTTTGFGLADLKYPCVSTVGHRDKEQWLSLREPHQESGSLTLQS